MKGMGLVRRSSLMIVVVGVLCTACRQNQLPLESGNLMHTHHPPHGGTAVELGKEEYHLELVHDEGTPQISAFILDGEMEKFVRLPLEEFVIRAGGGNGELLRFQAVANPATGEKVGDTSEYSATSPWLTNHGRFDGVLVEIKIGSKSYQGVSFNYPKGNE